MKVLVFGPSGSGKTYVSTALKKAGINAFDDSDIEGLSNWYDRNGKKVAAPATADEAMNAGYAFLWSKKTMANFINQFEEVYVFGGSGNIASVFPLFDRVYFLHVDPELQRERILNAPRPTPQMDNSEDGIVIWGDWFEQLAREMHIPFVDAAQSPENIYKIISSSN